MHYVLSGVDLPPAELAAACVSCARRVAEVWQTGRLCGMHAGLAGRWGRTSVGKFGYSGDDRPEAVKYVKLQK